MRCGARRLIASSVECYREKTRLDGDEECDAMRRDATVQVSGVCDVIPTTRIACARLLAWTGFSGTEMRIFYSLDFFFLLSFSRFSSGYREHCALCDRSWGLDSGDLEDREQMRRKGEP